MVNTSLISAKEVASILSLSKRQVFRLDSMGKIPAPVRVNGAVRWRDSDIQRWIALGCPNRAIFEATVKAEAA